MTTDMGPEDWKFEVLRAPMNCARSSKLGSAYPTPSTKVHAEEVLAATFLGIVRLPRSSVVAYSCTTQKVQVPHLFRFSIQKTLGGCFFGTRNLGYWVLGLSGVLKEKLPSSPVANILGNCSLVPI